MPFPPPPLPPWRPSPPRLRLQPPPRPLSPPVLVAGSREYTVQRGDTLYSIANKQLGSPKRWHEVLDLNTVALGGKPQGLRPGQTLRLPS